MVPIPCHSHNDYWRDAPLFSAIRAGCVGVEADVWFLPDGGGGDGDLLVGHDPAALTGDRTFRSLYVDPLVELLARTNAPPPHTVPSGGDDDTTRRRRRPRPLGVFDVDLAQTLVLLVDVKTDGAATWPRVLAELEPLRSRGWLTYFEDTRGGDGDDDDDDDGGKGGVVREGPVTVVGTGNTPFGLLTANSTYRDAFFDAPLHDMWEEGDEGEDGDGDDDDDDNNNNNKEEEEDKPLAAVKYNYTNSFYASTSFREAVGAVIPRRGGGGGGGGGGELLGEDQLRALRGQIRGAHRRGLRARYWDTPSWPVGLRNRVWRVLVEEEGADVLNVDDLHAASRLVW